MILSSSPVKSEQRILIDKSCLTKSVIHMVLMGAHSSMGYDVSFRRRGV